MALKSILEIDVNDSSFQRFSALFARYQEQVKSMPAAWAATGAAAKSASAAAADGAEATAEAAQGTAGAMAQAAASLNAIVAAAAGAAFQMGRASSIQHSVTTSARAQASAWHDTARSARSLAGHIGDATRSLLRWASVTGVISSILGGGGLFGIDRLAVSAGNNRRSALGIGVSAGEEKAFGLNYGRIVDPNHFLGGVNEALSDVTKRHTLYGAGLSESQLAGKDTAQVSTELIPALKRLADQTPQALLAQTLKARGLDQFISLQDFERLRNTSASEIGEYGKRYQQDRQGLNVADPTLKAWQDLQVQFKRSWDTLETTFVRGLVGLAGPIGNLSEAFSKAVGALLSSPQLKEWIDGLAKGIKWLGDYMLTDEFHTKVLKFMEGVGNFVSAIGNAITAVEGWVAWFRGNGPADAFKNGGPNGPLQDDNENAPGSPAFNRKRFGTPEGNSPGGTWDQNEQDRQNSQDWLQKRWERLKYRWNRGADSRPGAHKEVYQKLEGDNALPPGLLNAVERQESGFKDELSDAGAQGYFQFMPATAARYNVNPHDEISSATGAAHYFRDLMAEFHGDLEKSLAGYNWGQGNVENDIKAHGDRWRDYLPTETKNYVNNIMNNIRQPQHPQNSTIKVQIYNSPGGNPVVSSAQLVT